MFDLLIQLAKRYALKFVQLPNTLWIEMQWANLRYRESCHLLRLDDYLLKDMGLRKAHGRIEAIDPKRLDLARLQHMNALDRACRAKPAQQAN